IPKGWQYVQAFDIADPPPGRVREIHPNRQLGKCDKCALLFCDKDLLRLLQISCEERFDLLRMVLAPYGLEVAPHRFPLRRIGPFDAANQHDTLSISRDERKRAFQARESSLIRFFLLSKRRDVAY